MKHVVLKENSTRGRGPITQFRSRGAERGREEEGFSSPDYPSLSTSSVDPMGHQIPRPPPPPKVYWQQGSGIGSVQSYIATPRGGGKSKPYKQHSQHYWQQQSQLQQRQYHHAKEFVAQPSAARYVSGNIDGGGHRSVQSQAGGVYHLSHSPNSKTDMGDYSMRGANHNRERYVINSTDGSTVDIEPSPINSNAGRRRNLNM